ncbi:unnamed protein product [Colias eurytheme]|nr:unnamed protein product [Colias eurytheme]
MFIDKRERYACKTDGMVIAEGISDAEIARSFIESFCRGERRQDNCGGMVRGRRIEVWIAEKETHPPPTLRSPSRHQLLPIVLHLEQGRFVTISSSEL